MQGNTHWVLKVRLPGLVGLPGMVGDANHCSLFK
jgi:hypothetical protein